MSYTLKVLDLPEEGQPENPLMRTKHSYSYFNGIDDPTIEYEKKDGNGTACVIWNLKDQLGYRCINIPIIAYLMEKGVTIDTIKPD